MMKRKDIYLLEKLLGEFFEEYDINKKGMLYSNRIAKLLKEELSKKERWKNKNRGIDHGR